MASIPDCDMFNYGLIVLCVVDLEPLCMNVLLRSANQSIQITALLLNAKSISNIVDHVQPACTPAELDPQYYVIEHFWPNRTRVNDKF